MSQLSVTAKKHKNRRRNHKNIIQSSLILNKTYLDEEFEIQNHLKQSAEIATTVPLPVSTGVNKMKLDRIKDQSMIITHSYDEQMLFLTDKIFDNKFEGLSIREESSHQPDSNNSVACIDDATNVSDKNGQQLAATYLQVDDSDLLIEKYKINKLKTSNILYFPSLSKIKPSEELTSINQQFCDVNPVASEKFKELDGFMSNVDVKSIILPRNLNQMINRFLMEKAYSWLVQNPNDNTLEIANMKCFTINENILIKSFCTKEFIAVPYQREESLHLIGNEMILKIHILEMKFLSVDYVPDNQQHKNSEELLTHRIREQYDEYLRRKSDKQIIKLTDKLNVLRKLIAKCKTDTLPKNQSVSSDKLLILHNYQMNLKDLRNEIYRESRSERELLINILKNWHELKNIRERQGFNQTNLKLIIHSEPIIDVDEDQLNWDRKFQLELNERYNELMEIYQNYDHNIDGQHDIIEPFMNAPNINDLHDELHSIFVNSMRHPGEPIIHLELQSIPVMFGENRVPKINPSRELQEEYSLKLNFDNSIIGSSKHVQLQNDRRIVWNSIFTTKLNRKIPQIIKLLVFKEQRLISSKVAEIFIPMPEKHELFTDSNLLHLDFSIIVDKKINYPVKLYYKIGWETTGHMPSSASSSLNASNTLPGNDIEMTIKQNIQQINPNMKLWYDEQLLDPKDPDITSLVNEIEQENKENVQETIAENTTTDCGLFRLIEDEIAFCSEDQLNNDKRLNLLIARYRNDLKFKDYKFIPANEREIEIYDNQKIIEDLNWMEPIDVQRYNGKKYLRNVYKIITNHCDILNKNLESQNLLIGDVPPTISSFIASILELFAVKRPLNPNRRSDTQNVSRITFPPSKIQQFNIYINVIRAYGIPFRQSDQQLISFRKNSILSSTQHSALKSSIHNIVRPFVVVSFKDKTVRTSTGDGSNPTWNEQLMISINDEINHIKDDLCIQIYDEFIEDLLEDDRSRSTEIYQRISSRYLADLRIPFNTIYSAQRIDGTYEMNTPKILLGYTKPYIGSTTEQISVMDTMPEIKNSIYLTLLISLEPIIEKETFSTSELECCEINEVKIRSQLWYNQFKEEFPSRYQDPLVTLSNGKRISLTRLIGPIDIPFEITNDSEYLIRRFVSLIPINFSRDFCTKLNGVWITNDQLISSLNGSPKDIGVLLTCYYLSIGFYAFLVMGNCSQYGETTFVLTKESGEFFLINPHTGRKYLSKDTHCPLNRVYCIVNHQNIWANIQKENRVFLMRFDVNHSSEWRPLFNKSCTAPVELVHDTTFIYKDSLDVGNLEKIIELKIMKKISAWRPHRKTIWNRSYTDTLKQLLMELEEDACYANDHKSYSEKLSGLQTIYKVSGCPINMPYQNLSSIVTRIKTIGLHLNSDNKVEFALAIHIQKYPNNVLSLWIFLLTLIPRI